LNGCWNKLERERVGLRRERAGRKEV